MMQYNATTKFPQQCAGYHLVNQSNERTSSLAISNEEREKKTNHLPTWTAMNRTIPLEPLNHPKREGFDSNFLANRWGLKNIVDNDGSRMQVQGG